jgi:ATP-dependent Lon protease
VAIYNSQVIRINNKLPAKLIKSYFHISIGHLGDVIKESAQLALTWVKSNAHILKLVSNEHDNFVDKYDIHIHVPSGAVPKDGPSAGKI